MLHMLFYWFLFAMRKFQRLFVLFVSNELPQPPYPNEWKTLNRNTENTFVFTLRDVLTDSAKRLLYNKRDYGNSNWSSHELMNAIVPIYHFGPVKKQMQQIESTDWSGSMEMSVAVMTVKNKIIFNDLIMYSTHDQAHTFYDRMDIRRNNNNNKIDAKTTTFAWRKKSTKRRKKNIHLIFHDLFSRLFWAAGTAGAVVVDGFVCRSHSLLLTEARRTLTAWHKWDCSIFMFHFSQWNFICVWHTHLFAIYNMKCSHHIHANDLCSLFFWRKMRVHFMCMCVDLVRKMAVDNHMQAYTEYKWCQLLNLHIFCYEYCIDCHWIGNQRNGYAMTGQFLVSQQ